MSGLMQYRVASDGISSCLNFLDRALSRFEREGRVVARQHVTADAARGRVLGPRKKQPKRRTWHKKKPIPAELRAQIAQEYLGPEPLRFIAARHKCAICTITQIAQEMKLPPRGAGRRTDIINQRAAK